MSILYINYLIFGLYPVALVVAGYHLPSTVRLSGLYKLLLRLYLKRELAVLTLDNLG